VALPTRHACEGRDDHAAESSTVANDGRRTGRGSRSFVPNSRDLNEYSGGDAHRLSTAWEPALNDLEPIVRGERHTDMVIQSAYRVGTCVIGLVVCIAACSSGGGKHAAPTTLKAKAPTTLAPATSQPSTGTLAGTLRAVGGPAPGIDRAISGPITIVDPHGRRWRVRASARHGFAVKLPTGSYQVTGGGVNGSIECYGPSRVLVARDQTTRVPVVCEED